MICWGYDRSKYDLVLKVVISIRGRNYCSNSVSNDEYLSFFLDEISISIQCRIPLCVSAVERTTPAIPNLIQDSQFPSFVPQTAKAQKIHGHEDVP